jgi:hypothetical protein
MGGKQKKTIPLKMITKPLVDLQPASQPHIVDRANL